MEDDGGDRRGGGAVAPGEGVGTGDGAEGGEAPGEVADQADGHAAAVGQAVDVDAGRVDVVVAFQFEIISEMKVTSRAGSVSLPGDAGCPPALGEAGAGGMDDDEAVQVGEVIPGGEVALVRRPLGKAVKADDQRDGGIGIV